MTREEAYKHPLFPAFQQWQAQSNEVDQTNWLLWFDCYIAGAKFGADATIERMAPLIPREEWEKRIKEMEKRNRRGWADPEFLERMRRSRNYE